jgi:NADPH2:quinone reductase
MKAAFFDHPGPPDVLRYGDLPTPDPQPGQVRVRVQAASVNPIDTYIRSGLVAMPQPRPTIVGADFAGVVESVGHGVTRFKPGDAVWGSNQGLNGRPGTFAEFCCPAEEWVYPLPNGVDPKAAAAVALVGITAHLGLFHRAKLAAGEWVFVNGGTGGVGACVVQMAKAVGAKVITTVGTEQKAATACGLGADVVIDYTRDDVPAAVRAATNGKGVDVWYETLPPTDLDRTVELTAPRGRIVLMAGRQARPAFPNGAFYPKGLSVVGFAMFTFSATEQAVAAKDIAQWLASGQLKPLIGAEFPLSQASNSHQLQEDNTLRKAGTLTGKILVLPEKNGRSQ